MQVLEKNDLVLLVDLIENIEENKQTGAQELRIRLTVADEVRLAHIRGKLSRHMRAHSTLTLLQQS